MINDVIRHFKGRKARAHRRLNCMRISKLRTSGNASFTVGLLMDISNGGGLFRPAKEYIIQRNGEAIVLEVGSSKIASIRGTVVSSSARGYHIYFDSLIESELVEAIAAEMDINPENYLSHVA